MERFISMGKAFGLSGIELMTYAEKKLEEEILKEEKKEKKRVEREERIRLRDNEKEFELKKLQMDMEAEERITTREAEDSLKMLQMEAEEKNKIRDADLVRARLDSELKFAQFNLESQDRQKQN